MAFNTDTERMLESASRLEGIRDEVLSSLGRYMMTDQDLTGGAFQGMAALASMRTTEDISTTGSRCRRDSSRASTRSAELHTSTRR